MPIALSESEVLILPAEVKPEVTAPVAWIETIVIRAPMDDTWSAIAESYPTDGTKVYRRDADGKDTCLRIESQSLQKDMETDQSLALEVNACMKAIIAVTTKIKALRDAEKETAAKLAAEQKAKQDEVNVKP